MHFHSQESGEPTKSTLPPQIRETVHRTAEVRYDHWDDAGRRRASRVGAGGFPDRVRGDVQPRHP